MASCCILVHLQSIWRIAAAVPLLLLWQHMDSVLISQTIETRVVTIYRYDGLSRFESALLSYHQHLHIYGLKKKKGMKEKFSLAHMQLISARLVHSAFTWLLTRTYSGENNRDRDYI